MPEYGRHVQKMIDYVISIPDKDKRNEQIRAVLNTMGILNPQLRDINDFVINCGSRSDYLRFQNRY